jgi:hypothetical protein
MVFASKRIRSRSDSSTTINFVGSTMAFCATAYLWAYVGLSFGSALDQSWVANASSVRFVPGRILDIPAS